MDLKIRTPRSDDYSEYAEKVRSGARSRAGERGQLVRHEVGERMFDLMTEYFPEEYRERRREELIRTFGAGIAVGFLGRELVRYARR
ncbi:MULTISPECIES: hypothetical protein [Halobaculum]|uniref:Uncharacterized protein n=2 Tax=Halobaculum TaxID=43927 RepID=A0A8T8WB36_9EURY|nr:MULTISPECIES: hypothetical protein [Halobaculum]QZP36973.1 hypothetical protein K6T50_11815 [Halobaculum magnesiiphilum]QZY02024.1 hypothetical protein K6T36_11990 [Halobaculum roseum]